MSRKLDVRFVTSNKHKLAEAAKILSAHGINVIKASLKIEELQTKDTKSLIRDKVVKAFEEIGRPLFVEHTGLCLKQLNGMPGGLTQVFWDTLEADRFAELYGKAATDPSATAETFIAYCDGRRIFDFYGKIDGGIVPEPRGSRDFQWDCVFQPNGSKETFAEMGDKKNEISMRRIAPRHARDVFLWGGNSMIDSLIEAVRTGQAILFVGAGVSGVLGLPLWRELIAEMANQLDYDPSIFELHGDFLELAEYYKLQKTTIGSLRSWMDTKWHGDEQKVDGSRVHQAIVDLKAPIIYTTNYDRWLEIAYQRRGHSFTKIANVGDFTKIRDGVTQIVKLHGDFSDDSSLVLTETSYFARLSFDSPLDIKLRSDSIGKSILFIGYSLSDINVRYLLYKLHLMWSESGYAAARPKSYVFLSRPNPVQEAILEHRGIIPLISEVENRTEGLIEFLEKVARGASATS
jgi:non-canonical purine NTP pyrophosphatase (RdgB/HAM1 family)